MTESFGLPPAHPLLERWGHWSSQLLIAAIGVVILAVRVGHHPGEVWPEWWALDGVAS